MGTSAVIGRGSKHGGAARAACGGVATIRPEGHVRADCQDASLAKMPWGWRRHAQKEHQCNAGRQCLGVVGRTLDLAQLLVRNHKPDCLVLGSPMKATHAVMHGTTQALAVIYSTSVRTDCQVYVA
mmetsp:Transcript_21901/g.42704  ORF Transcript_21901/g.42704 Transcript_21901/m.42704 type:complete len:126 (-) Transcript_21901:260-637(-)